MVVSGMLLVPDFQGWGAYLVAPHGASKISSEVAGVRSAKPFSTAQV
jgi:hypothetical protein